jgi:protoheme IX farnesyltransferase
MWLKRSTAQNIVIGGAAGAFPPMIGWVAVTGSISLEAIILFLIIFLWTPPHFWALALVKNEDYARAGVPMLPVVSGDRTTRNQILLYTIILTPVVLSPYWFGFGGALYLASAVIGSGFMLWWAWDIFAKGDEASDRKACWRMFGGSILFLFALFASLLIERLSPALFQLVSRFAGFGA